MGYLNSFSCEGTMLKLFAGLVLSLGLTFSGSGEVTVKSDCCAQKLACCAQGKGCCDGAKLGCCAKGMACCAKDLGCCAVEACCQKGAACCDEAKACCGPTARKAGGGGSVPAECCRR
jgi:hypothetical protein